MKLGLIRVITSQDRQFLDSHGRALERRYGFTVRTECLPDQPHGVHDGASFQSAAKKMPDVARKLERDGVQAIIISCAADPGIEAARAAVGVPVYGAGACGAALAIATGGKVGVLGLSEQAPTAVTSVLGDRLVASRAPSGIRRTTELTTPEGAQAAIQAATELPKAGAETILFACTGLTTLNLAGPVSDTTGLPVIDTVAAAGLMASYHTRQA